MDFPEAHSAQYLPVTTEQDVIQQQQYMKQYDCILILCFLSNSLVYFNINNQSVYLIYIQLAISLLCVIPIIIYHGGKQSFPYYLVLGITLLLAFVSIFVNINKLAMIVPVLFLVGIKGIRSRVGIIGTVLLESIWMFISLLVLYYTFGTIGYMAFKDNGLYFQNQFQGSLSILQISTLDQVGDIVRMNYKKSGFFLSFFIILTALLLIHTLININMGFILQFIAGKKVKSNNDELFGEHVPLEIKWLKWANLILSIYLLFIPFQYKYNFIYLITTCLSTLLVIILDYLRSQLFSKSLGFNIILMLVIILTYVLQQPRLNFITCLLRIALIDEIIALWKKIMKVFISVSTLFSLSIFTFVIFSFMIFIMNQNTQESKNMELSFILALQIMTLDDWTRLLRQHKWYFGIVIVVYVLLINHFLLNAVIAEVFSEIQQENDDRPQQIEQSAQVLVIDEEAEVEKFVKLVKELHYVQRNQNTNQNVIQNANN